MEWLVSTNNANTYIMDCQFFLLSWGTKSFDTMFYEGVSVNTWEWIEVLLKICLSWLTFCSNCHCMVLVEVTWWASFEQMGACLINTTDEYSHTEWSLTCTACFSLMFSSNLINQSFNWVSWLMSIPVIEWFVSHKLVKESCIGSESWEDHTQMIINIINLFLVLSQFIRGHFKCNEDLVN